MWRHVCRSLSPLLSWLKFDMYCLCYHINLWKSVSDLQSIAHTRSQSYSNTAGTWLSVRWSGREREAGRGSGREIESDREWMKVSLCVCLDMWVSVWVRVCARSVCSVAHRAIRPIYTPRLPRSRNTHPCHPWHLFAFCLFLTSSSHFPSFTTALILFSSPSSLGRCYSAAACYHHHDKILCFSGLSRVEVKWREQTDQGHWSQKSVIRFFQSLRVFCSTKEQHTGT